VGLSLFAGSLIVSGCLARPTPWVGSGLRVGVAGDSEIYQLEHDTLNDSQHHLTDALVVAGFQVSTADVIGASTNDLAALLNHAPETAGWPVPAPQITVTALGVNDMHIDADTGQPHTPVAAAQANLTAYLDQVDAAGSRCDALVEIPETTPWGLDGTGPVWNAFLASTAETHVVVVVPWASTVAQHPEYVRSDGVHQTTAGKTAYLAAILAAVRNCAAQT